MTSTDTPTWDAAPAARPAAYAQALENANRTRESLEECTNELRELTAAAQDAPAALKRAARDADAAGKPLKLPAQRDFERDRLVLEGQLQNRKTAHAQARNALRACISDKDLLTTWLAALAALVQPARAAALAALEQGKPAEHVAALEAHWTSLLDACSQVWFEIDPGTRHGRGAQPRRETYEGPSLVQALAQVDAALEQTRKRLESDDPALGTGWMQESGMEPPRYLRVQWAESWNHERLQELFLIESREDFRHTSFSKPYAVRVGWLSAA